MQNFPRRGVGGPPKKLFDENFVRQKHQEPRNQVPEESFWKWGRFCQIITHKSCKTHKPSAKYISHCKLDTHIRCPHRWCPCRCPPPRLCDHDASVWRWSPGCWRWTASAPASDCWCIQVQQAPPCLSALVWNIHTHMKGFKSGFKYLCQSERLFYK